MGTEGKRRDREREGKRQGCKYLHINGIDL